MKRLTARSLVVAAVALAVVVGAGAAIAATGNSATSPSAFLDSLAQHLGVSREKLDDATRAASLDQVEAALDAGTITKEQADALQERIESGDVPVFGLGLGRGFGPGFGHGPGVRGLGGHLDAAAEYLGLTEDALRSRLAGGKTLAQIAEAEGKSVAGLQQALVADVKARLAAAVKDGKLTEEQAANMLERYTEHVGALVDGTLRFGDRPHGFGPPPGTSIAPGSHGSFAPAGGAPA
jgi:hypothetical protein